MLQRSGGYAKIYKLAGMMELADVTDSKSVGVKPVWVQVPLPAPVDFDNRDCRIKQAALKRRAACFHTRRDFFLTGQGRKNNWESSLFENLGIGA